MDETTTEWRIADSPPSPWWGSGSPGARALAPQGEDYMKIRITFQLDTTDRRAIAAQVDETHPADYQTCRNALESWALLELDSIRDEYEATPRKHAKRIENDNAGA